MQSFEANDFVYIPEIGFCQLVNCGRHKSIKIQRKEELSLTSELPIQKRVSLYFPPDSFLFEQEINPPPAEVQPQQPPEVPPQPVEGEPPKEAVQKKEQPTSEVTNDPNIVTAKIVKTNILVYTPENNLTKTIILRVKTFFGERRELEVHASIYSTILQLKNNIIQLSKEPMGNVDNPRLISTFNGVLIEYANPKEFVYSTKLKNYCKIIMLANIRFTMDTAQKGPSLNVTNSNRTVGRQVNDGGYQICLGNTVFHSGRHYFQTKIDKMTDDEQIIIGVAQKTVKLSGFNIEEEPIWGYLCLAGKKIGHEPESPESLKDYGPYCKVNDIVGTLIQINANNKCTLSYYVNGKFAGKAFKEIQTPICPAICLNASPNVQVTINPAAEIPFDLSNFGS